MWGRGPASPLGGSWGQGLKVLSALGGHWLSGWPLGVRGGGLSACVLGSPFLVTVGESSVRPGCHSLEGTFGLCCAPRYRERLEPLDMGLSLGPWQVRPSGRGLGPWQVRPSRHAGVWGHLGRSWEECGRSAGSRAVWEAALSPHPRLCCRPRGPASPPSAGGVWRTHRPPPAPAPGRPGSGWPPGQRSGGRPQTGGT